MNQNNSLNFKHDLTESEMDELFHPDEFDVEKLIKKRTIDILKEKPHSESSNQTSH